GRPPDPALCGTYDGERRLRGGALPEWEQFDEQEDGGADEYEEGADREGRVEVDVELGVDGQRKCLRDALEAPREEERGSILAQPEGGRKGRRRAGTGSGERDGDAPEGPRGSRAQRAGGVEQASVERLERSNCAANVERPGDQEDRHHYRRLCEADRDA